MVDEHDHLGGRFQQIRRQVGQMPARELDAAHDVAGGELGAGAAGFLVAHQIADIVHQGADQRRIDVVAVQAVAGQVQAVQHARGTQHHLVGVRTVVIQGLQLLVAGKPAIEGPVEQVEGTADARQVMARCKAADDRSHLRLHLGGVAGIAQRGKGAVVVHAVHLA